MPENWSVFIKQYRARHGLTQGHLGDLVGVSQRTISRWERAQDKPCPRLQSRLRDLVWQPPSDLLQRLSMSVEHCPVPRALSRTRNIRLIALSRPAIEKRPSVTDWIGRDLIGLACGVLEEMLDDKHLQQAIVKREIWCVTATTRSVLRTKEHPNIGMYQTAITYFSHDGDLYSDAISMPAPADAVCGYKPVYLEDACGERHM